MRTKNKRRQGKTESKVLVYMVIEWDASMQVWRVTVGMIQVGSENVDRVIWAKPIDIRTY